MHVIHARNVNLALPEGILYLQTRGRRRGSRNGEVVVSDVPVTTAYREPMERVLFLPERDANPFFHLHEGLWMLAGRNDVASVAAFVARMRDFSDDGETLHGAYGHRWRCHFDRDQLELIASRLRVNPEDRRCVLAMWDAAEDLDVSSQDLPCNTHVYFSVSWEGRLDMTVCCRSNDIIWGAYGANAVHMSMLQEYMAAKIGTEVGRYWQVSNNFHAYTATLGPLEKRLRRGLGRIEAPVCPYSEGEITPRGLVTECSVDEWEASLARYIREEPFCLDSEQVPFFRTVAKPMRESYRAHKRGDYVAALGWAQGVAAADWRRAAVQWLRRRYEA